MQKEIILPREELLGMIKEAKERRLFKLIEEAISPDFNFKVFCNMDSLEDMFDYATKYIGEMDASGSSRAVFQISDKLCLKLALNQAGIEQNRKEAERNDGRFVILTAVHYQDPKNRFLISEYAIPLRFEDVEPLLGIDANGLRWFAFRVLQLKDGYNIPKDEYDEINYLVNDDSCNIFFRCLCYYLLNSDQTTLDVGEYDNLGIVDRYGSDFVVILDSGFDDDIHDKFYNKD